MTTSLSLSFPESFLLNSAAINERKLRILLAGSNNEASTTGQNGDCHSGTSEPIIISFFGNATQTETTH